MLFVTKLVISYILLVLHALFTKYTLNFSLWSMGALFSVQLSPTTKYLADDLLRNGRTFIGKLTALPSPC